ncbi:response regulator transcription factor [Tannockella kyphosi]|uniref:response regulator transcription factor n=1 Tax=Tannockella kyphosi TaxID=2899121 RepID=UPI0020138BB9|nr:response regulator transcription factor [Tannockella kyphosi]
MNKILIIEDDITIASIEKDYLEINNFEVDIEIDGAIGYQKAIEGNYNLIILDLMLPTIDGFTICKRLRESIDIPIIMVSALREDIDKIRGLGIGADDFIEKPFSPSVLVAKVKSNIAQYARLTKNISETIVYDKLAINTKTRRVFIEENEIELKNKEYELLLFLVTNYDVVFSKETLYERIWGMDALGDNATVAVHINRLREKIELDPGKPNYIQTVRGAGYRFKK